MGGSIDENGATYRNVGRESAGNCLADGNSRVVSAGDRTLASGQMGAGFTSCQRGVMGGHMFSIAGDQQGVSALLQIPPMIANLGTGLLYLASWLLGIGFADDPTQAARATYEYGNTFLLIAGLLNYLSMLDAFDISAGRKS